MGDFPLASEQRTADSDRFWTVFQVMSAINVGALALVVDAVDQPARLIPVAIVGVVTSYAWWGVQLRYAAWCNWWDRKSAELESKQSNEIVDIYRNRTLEREDFQNLPVSFWRPGRVPLNAGGPGFSSKAKPVEMARLFVFVWFLLIPYSVLLSHL